ASHGYLPAQFLNPAVNLRTDAYGGSLENRLRFSVEALTAIRAATDGDFVIGLRISADERDDTGLDATETLAACRHLEPLLDFVNVTAGTSATQAGAVHIVPPMAYPAAYLGAEVKRIKAALTVPVF
ncbi:MAG: oxidoreductase, partial [Rhodobacteraceae bacterium]|nr:oxidoreductase [Paracoccaceae bacterium]